MENITKILPLGFMIIGAIVVVWRGMRTKPDSTNNQALGGGAYSQNRGMF